MVFCQYDKANFIGHYPNMNYSRAHIVELIDDWLADNPEESLRSLATQSGLNYDTLYSFKVKRPDSNMLGPTIEKLLHVVGKTETSISEVPQIPVVGHAGAGDSVLNFDDHPKGHGLEEVDCPPGVDPRKVVAVRVRGDSMLPVYEDGDVLYFTRDRDGVPPNCLNKTCIVKLRSDGVLVKKVTKGSKAGHYHLISKNAAVAPIVDAQIRWAARVIFVKPC